MSFHDIKVRIDPDVPENEVWLETPTQRVKMTNLAMPEPKPIQPTSFWSPSKALEKRRDPRRMLTGQQEEWRIAPPHYHPNAEMRAQGFTRNPAICGHERTRLSDSTMRWRCRDCGEWLE